MDVNFNIPCSTGKEKEFVLQALESSKLSGDGYFGKNCQNWFENALGCYKALLTPSCTAALEMAAVLFDIQPGDEVIMPSYTFVSTANAFALRGAKIVFVDIRQDTMNIDESLIERAITKKTKVIVPVHYAGVACDMDIIMDIAERYNLYVVEDAAQGMMGSYKDKPLGTIGHIGTYSFHETKNYTSGGEGGLLIVNDIDLAARSEIVREKGTDRSKFLRGQTDKYTWVDVGSSYLPSELQAAFLWGQLISAHSINKDRLEKWNYYYNSLRPLQVAGLIELQSVPVNCVHNAHMFYIKLTDINERTDFISYLKNKGISAVFHYIPLHSSPAGQKLGHFIGEDKFTTRESGRLVRLPIYYGITNEQIELVIQTVWSYFDKPKIL